MEKNLHELDNESLINIIHEKTDYLSIIIHQIRTPLTAQKWLLEMLENGSLGITIPDNQKELIHKSHQNSIDALGFLREISEINHITSWQMQVKPVETNLIQVLEHAITLVSTIALSKHISLVKNNFTNTSIPIYADPEKLVVVFQNLLENAIKYSPPGSTVTLETHLQTDSIILSITDHGIGIGYDDQKYVFDKLYRAHNAKDYCEGTGMGLYIAKTICEYHRGLLWFESIPQIGTSFFIQLPLLLNKVNH